MKHKKKLIKSAKARVTGTNPYDIVMAKFPIPENCSAHVPMIWKLFANTSVISLTETCIYICTRVYHNVTISLKKFSSPIH
jgi:hypothetical protein